MPASVRRMLEEILVTANRSHEPTAVIRALVVFGKGPIGYRPPPAGTFLFGRRTRSRKTLTRRPAATSPRRRSPLFPAAAASKMNPVRVA
ncbi:hypothetical protein E2562_039004 [Oryza meyeriana var. granulata]|uniref:Uncharacterized protein n=1 Tax=Oryza meyeriana var. granulata TaxID=110450 RepID=A0A6G1C3N5_9ORYZ|nr:hypothetical protein E2562_039004 [Oryza meyeriana var. granulata]